MANKINEFNSDNLREHLIALEKGGELDDLINDIKGISKQTTLKNYAGNVKTLNMTKRKNKKNPMLGVGENRFYAVVASNGYALYRVREKCEGQVVTTDPARGAYLRDAYVESFDTSGEAMAWIKAALESYFGITDLELPSVAYMLKWETVWFTKGIRMPWEQRQQSYSNYNDY